MTCTAWTGPFQPSLETAWLDALPELSSGDPLAEVWLLVPSRFLGLHLARLAARRRGIVNLRVLTFTDLADRILGTAGNVRPPRLPPVGELLVLRQAIRETVPDDGYFAAVRERRRFPAALAATLTELRTAGTAPEDLERAARASSEASAVKLREAAAIVRHAGAALAAAGFSHPTDALWAAATHAPAAALDGPRGLAVYGFTEWNAAERALLGAVMRRVATVCFVPAEPGPPFELLGELTDWLRAQGFTIRTTAGDPPRTGPRAVASRLFHPPTDPAPGPAGLEIVAAPGEEREVREIARRILAAAADGIPFEAMGLLVRRPETYRHAIRDVFTAAGIPYTWGVAPRIGDTRSGRALRLLVATRLEGFARTAVVEFLAAANLRHGDGVEPAEWDRLSRDAGIVQGEADWRRGLRRLARRAEAESPAGSPADDEGEAHARPPALSAPAIHALGKVVGTLLDSARRWPERAPAAAFARALLRTLLRLCRRDTETDEAATVLVSLQALAPLGTPVSLEEFADLLDAALETPAEPLAESRLGKVFVGELHQSLGLPFRLVIIPGLVEQGFPAPSRGDPILVESERRLLWSQVPGGRPGLGLPERRPAEERLAFRLAAAAAEERLVLTYPRVDPQSGRARVPSFFLLRVAEAAMGRAYDFSRLQSDCSAYVRVSLRPASGEALERPLDHREWLLAQAAEARRRGPVEDGTWHEHLPHAARGRAALVAREQEAAVTTWDGLLDASLLGLLSAHHRPTDTPVAATPLETYATCPFRYYLAHVLHLAPPVEPERVLTLAPRDRGRFLHHALAEAYTAFRDEGLLPLTPDRLPAARAVIERAFARAEAAFGPTGLAPFWKGERARLLADVLAAVVAEARSDAGWVPTAFEASFGAGDGPIVVHALLDGRLVAFRGRIDRLDLGLDGTRARVIDYKAGGARGSAGRGLAGGTALQLPIYRLAAELLCGALGAPAQVEEAQYYYLTRRGGRRRVRFTDADWAARRTDFDRVLAAVLDGIGAGRFFQNPSPETCRVCDYESACGTERERIAWVEAKRADPVREAYERLQAIE